MTLNAELLGMGPPSVVAAASSPVVSPVAMAPMRHVVDPVTGKEVHLEYTLTAKVKKTAYTCPECGKGYNSRGGIRVHRLAHQGIYKFTCEDCSQGFTCVKNYNEHRSKHTGVGHFHCKWCGQTFRFYTEIREHQLRCSGPKAGGDPEAEKSS